VGRASLCLLPIRKAATPRKGQVQAARDAAARQQRALAGIRLAVREALGAGLSADAIGKAFATVLRESGLLGTANDWN